MTTTKELIAAVKAHAAANYESGGWDVLVECYEDEEIAEVIAEYDLTTEEEVVAHFAKSLGLHDEIRQDIEGEAF